MWDLKQRNRLIRYKEKLVVYKWKRGGDMDKIDEGIEKYKKAKWLSEEGLQIAEKIREVKGK